MEENQYICCLPPHVCFQKKKSELSFFPSYTWFSPTRKSLIEEHARLNLSNFLSTLLANFYGLNEKFYPAPLLIYLVNKKAGCQFFQHYSFIPVGLFFRDFRVHKWKKSFLHSFHLIKMFLPTYGLHDYSGLPSTSLETS